MKRKPYKCPNCSSFHTIWKGYRKLNQGKVRLLRCKDCGRKFTSKKKFLEEDE